MGQWGHTYKIDGAEFIVHLDTGHPFGAIKDDSIVDTFLLSSSSGNKERDNQIEYHLRNMFVGKKISILEAWYHEYQVSNETPKPTQSPWAKLWRGS